MKQDQFTWNWYHWLLVHHSQWMILEPLYYSSFLFATLVYGVIGINFVDHSLIQGAPAGHESADTPTGHESNGAVAGDRTSNQMVPLPLPLLGTNHKPQNRKKKLTNGHNNGQPFHVGLAFFGFVIILVLFEVVNS